MCMWLQLDTPWCCGTPVRTYGRCGRDLHAMLVSRNAACPPLLFPQVTDPCPFTPATPLPHHPFLPFPSLQDDGLSGIGKALSYDVHTPLIQKTPLAHTALGEKLS
mgnify:CR=1 FL=1